MRRILLTCLVVLASMQLLYGVAAAQAPFQFKLGFKALADQIPEVVGTPLEDEHFNLANGNAEQRTSKGLLVWRKADNWTAFTNGSITWINGPYGVQSRLNTERYPWEQDPPTLASPAPIQPAPQPAPAPSPAPSPSPAPVVPRQGPYTPELKAMDEQAGGPAISLKERLREIDEEWARTWGWRPSKPVVIRLYSDGVAMASAIGEMLGESFTEEEKIYISWSIAGIAMNDPKTGGYAVAMNVGHYTPGQASGDVEFTATMVHEYTHVMQLDVAGEAGPTWFVEGMAELLAYTKAPTSPARAAEISAVSRAKREGYLPTLRQMQNNWVDLVGGQWRAGEVYGASYLAVRYLAEMVGGMPLRLVLEMVASGADFDSALSSITGYTVERLDAEYRANIRY